MGAVQVAAALASWARRVGAAHRGAIADARFSKHTLLNRNGGVEAERDERLARRAHLGVHERLGARLDRVRVGLRVSYP